MPATAAYAVAIFAILFAATSALVLFYTVEHIDPPDHGRTSETPLPLSRAS